MRLLDKDIKLIKVVRKYMDKVPEVKSYCKRCLEGKRWEGNVILMVVDAGFTSIGLNYFTAVVPKVFKFKEKFIDKGKIRNFEDFLKMDVEELRRIWKNRRSWEMIKEIIGYFLFLKNKEGIEERETIRLWAKNASLENWRKDPVGRIKGVGINSFQYLRMMGGVDTVMPDKIVKRVIHGMLKEAGISIERINDIEFIKLVHEMGRITGYRPIELCWMTWLVQEEGERIRIDKYKDVLPLI